MFSIKRKNLTEAEEERMLHVLRTTDVSFGSIASRFNCHESVVQKLNKKHNARLPRVRETEGEDVKSKPAEKRYPKRNIAPTKFKGSFL